MKRVLLDQGLAPAAAEMLRQEEWEAVHVSGAGLAESDDLGILEYAKEHEPVCVTLHQDFRAALALSLAGQPPVILLRGEGPGANAQADLIRRIWPVAEEAIPEGAAV